MARSDSLPPADAVAANALLVAVRQSADVICDRWSISLLLAAFLGARRFADFIALTGASGGILTTRLKKLARDGLLLKTPYSRRPLRHDYWLTNMGREFFAVVVELVRWEQRWFPDPTNPIQTMIERTAPERLAAPLRCPACGEAITARSVDVEVSRALLRAMPPKTSPYRRSTISRDTPAAAAPPLLGPSLDLLGDKWSIEIINCAFLPIRRFGEFRALTGIAANILTDRLNRLVEVGFLAKGDDRRPGRSPAGYYLTEVGIAFYPVLLRMQDWADDWITDRYSSPVALIHRPCGATLYPRSAAARAVLRGVQAAEA
jgi:DNA-binding HxlR family transcriptional regulator